MQSASTSGAEPAPPGAIFNQEPVCVVDAALIERLKAEALRSPLGRYRICMHHSTDDPMQDMVVAHCRGNYSRPHYHPNAAMSYTMVEGRMDVLIFDEAGAVTQRVRMASHGDAEGGIISLHLSAAIVYTPVTLTETAVFHETLAGPNPNGQETLYAAWSPTEDDAEGIAAYYRRSGIST